MRSRPLREHRHVDLDELRPWIDSRGLPARRLTSRAIRYDERELEAWLEWAVVLKTTGVATPARIYDLRSTFTSNALAAGVIVFELARVIGTSVRVIEKHNGTLLDGAHAGIAGRLAAIEMELEEGCRRGA